MPRIVTISLPAARTEELVGELRGIDGLVSLQVLPGASRQPRGDVVTAGVTDRCLPDLMRILDRRGVGTDPDVSVTMSEPTGLVSATRRNAIARDPASSTLEEMEFLMGREGTMGLNKTLVMMIAGAVATVGIATNSLHVAIAAMVIAPGFEPLLRMALAVVANRDIWWRGALDTVKGYGALLIGAGGAALLLPAIDVSLPSTGGGYLAPGTLLNYWAQVNLTGTVVTALGGLAGALLVAGNRSVLTAGVMIALALVPSATLTGVGLVTADLSLAGAAALRWLHDAVIVFAAGLVVLGAKRAARRRTMLD